MTALTITQLKERLRIKQEEAKKIGIVGKPPQEVSIRWQGKLYKSKVSDIPSVIENTGFLLPSGVKLRCSKYLRISGKPKLLAFEVFKGSSTYSAKCEEVKNDAPVTKNIFLRLPQLRAIADKNNKIKVELELDLNDMVVFTSYSFDQYIDSLIVDKSVVGGLLSQISVKPIRVTEKNLVLCEISADAGGYLDR